MAAVANLCNSGLVMSNGRVAVSGSAQLAIKHYMQKSIANGLHYVNANKAKADRISEVKIFRKDKGDNESFSFDETINIKISIEHGSRVASTHVGMAILDKWHQKIFTDTIKLTEQQLTLTTTNLIVEVPNRTLLSGVYYVDIALFVPKLTNFDYVTDACTFEIEDIKSELALYNGSDIGNVMIKCKWQPA
jgi:hypothetical protein